MDDATRSSSAFTIFNGVVAVHGLAVVPGKEWATLVPGKEWTSVKCASKIAYGCGKVGEQLLGGLALYVRRADHVDLTTSMAIGLNDEAAESIVAELGFPRSRLEAKGSMKIAHRQVLVLLLTFKYHCIYRRFYYLVYDLTNQSLYMIPNLPPEVKATYTLTPIPDRSNAGVGLKLALMARMACPEKGNSYCLCICTPAAKSDITVPWQTKVHRFLTLGPSELCQPFLVDAVFSLEGKIFWADLSQGVAYSDLGEKNSVVRTNFIKLPNEYLIQYPTQKELARMGRRQAITPTFPAKMSRTMGCIKDSIKFICIDFCPGNEMVKVLTLDLNDKVWKEEDGYSCTWDDLWKQVCFKNPELRDVKPLEPQYPVLMEDGALVVLLSKVPKEVSCMEGNYYICSFDMRSKSVQHFGVVRNYHTLSPVILPHDFFTKEKDPPPSLSSLLEQTADVQ